MIFLLRNDGFAIKSRTMMMTPTWTKCSAINAHDLIWCNMINGDRSSSAGAAGQLPGGMTVSMSASFSASFGDEVMR